MKPMMEDAAIEMVQGNHIMFWNGKELVFYNRISPITISLQKDVLDQCINKHNIYGSAWNKLIRRSFIENKHLYFKEGIVFEDILWFFYVQKYLSKVYISKDITYYYYERPSSIITSNNMKIHGSSYQIIYQDILQHLTVGSERKELNGYIFRFLKLYCLYLDIIPAFKDTYRLYQKQARKYGCWKVLILLNTIRVIRMFGISIGILRRINKVRWGIIEWYDYYILGHKYEGVNCDCML